MRRLDNYYYNYDWWAGCGVIGEDLLDQDPPRTKRQQRDQGGNGRTWPNWKDDLD